MKYTEITTLFYVNKGGNCGEDALDSLSLKTYRKMPVSGSIKPVAPKGKNYGHDDQITKIFDYEKS